MIRMPPYADLLGLSVENDADGPLLAMPFATDVLGCPGFLHGGAISGQGQLIKTGSGMSCAAVVTSLLDHVVSSRGSVRASPMSRRLLGRTMLKNRSRRHE